LGGKNDLPRQPWDGGWFLLSGRIVGRAVAQIGILLLAGCSEPKPVENTVDGYLLLQQADGSRSDYAFDEYTALDSCTEEMAWLFSNESDGDEPLADFWWTDPGSGDGAGEPQPGWVRNFILGTRCERKPGANFLAEPAPKSEGSNLLALVGLVGAIMTIATAIGVWRDFRQNRK